MADWLITYRKHFFAAMVLLTIGLIAGISQLRIDFKFDDFYPRDDPEFGYYDTYQELFYESQNYLVVVALESPSEDIFNSSFLTLSDSVFGEIAELDGIDSVVIGTRYQQLKRSGLGYRSRDLIDWSSPATLEKSKERVRKDSLFVGSFASRSLKHICAFFYLNPSLFDSPERDVLNRKVSQMVIDSGLKYYISGIPYIRTQYIDKLGVELLFFLSMSALLLFAALIALYRTLWGVLVPLLVAFAALGCTLGLMGWTGEALSILSNLLIPIMFVVSMSDVIHLMTKYQGIAQAGGDKIDALRSTLKQIGLATFLTSLTTAIGFGALMVSRIGPIRSFGLYAACGVLLTFIVSVAILAFALPKLKPSQFAKPEAFASSNFWQRMLERLNVFIRKSPIGITVGMLVLLVTSGLLMTRIPFDNYLIQDMGEKEEARISMRFFEKEMYGMRSFELGIHARQGYEVSDKKVLDEMAKIEQHLTKQVTSALYFSPSSFVQQANFLYHNSRYKYRKIPDSQEDIDELLNFASLNGADPILNQLMDSSRQRARRHARIPDIGTEAFGEITKDLDQFIRQNCDTTVFYHHMTGHAFLTERNLDYLRDSLMLGLLIAFLLDGGNHGLIVSFLENAIGEHAS